MAFYEVPGIGKKRVEKIRESWEKQKDIKNVMLSLQGYGVSTAYAAKIYRQYGKDSLDKVKDRQQESIVFCHPELVGPETEQQTEGASQSGVGHENNCSILYRLRTRQWLRSICTSGRTCCKLHRKGTKLPYFLKRLDTAE